MARRRRSTGDRPRWRRPRWRIRDGESAAAGWDRIPGGPGSADRRAGLRPPPGPARRPPTRPTCRRAPPGPLRAILRAPAGRISFMGSRPGAIPPSPHRLRGNQAVCSGKATRMLEPTTIAALLRELAVYYELEGDRHRAFAYERASKSIEAANRLHRLDRRGPARGAARRRPVDRPRGRRAGPDRYGAGARAPAHAVAAGRDRARAAAEGGRAEGAPDLPVARSRRSRGGGGAVPRPASSGSCRGSARSASRRSCSRSRSGAARRAPDPDRRRGPLHLDGAPPARRSGGAGASSCAARCARWCEIVDRLAFAVASDRRDAIADRLASFALVTSVDRASREDTAPDAPLIVAFLAGGMRAEVHVAPPAKLGWAQIAATGSARARRAAPRPRRRARHRSRHRLEAEGEPLVYTALGLPWIPPELRDGTDEIAAALAGDRFAGPDHARRSHLRVPLPHHVQRRQAHRRGDGAGRRRARLRRHHDHRPLGGRRVRQRPRPARGCASRAPRSPGLAPRRGSCAAPRPISSPTARSTSRPRRCPSSTW